MCVFADRMRGGQQAASHAQRLASPTPGSSQKANVAGADVSVDFELDIKVGIDSGQFVLHPKVTDDERARSRLVPN